MNRALMMAIAGTLHPVHGSALCRGAIIGSTGSGQGSASINLTIPQGTIEGDWAIIAVSSRATTSPTYTFPAGAITTTFTQWDASSPGWAQLATYQLTAADIVTGYITISASIGTQYYFSATASMVVFTGLEVADVVDAVSISTLSDGSGTSPETITASGITTTTPDVLVLLTVSAGYDDAKFGAPDGWYRLLRNSSIFNNMRHDGAYKVLSSPGATGDVNATRCWSSDYLNDGNYFAALIALKIYDTTFRLIGDVADGTTGGTVDAHLTLGGNIVYPVTISGLPSWLNDPGGIASGTDVHLTGTYPATAQTYTFTPIATDSSAAPQTASDAQSVVVSEAGTSPVLVQQAGVCISNSSNTGFDMALPSAPTAGNTLLAVLRDQSSSATSNLTMPTGWTRIARSAITNSSRHVEFWTKTSDGTETTTSVTSSYSGRQAGAIQEWEGAVTVSDWAANTNAADDSVPIAIGPSLAPPSAGAIPIAWVYCDSAQMQTPTWTSGWTGTTDTPEYLNRTWSEIAAMDNAPNAAVSCQFGATVARGGASTGFWYTATAWVSKA